MPPADETFSVENDLLMRHVVPSHSSRRESRPYFHTCTLKVYEDVAYAIDALGGETFTGESIREAIDAPFTQVMVAMAFLKERGCIVPAHGRQNRAASNFVYEDAMIEWHALREKLERH